MCSCTMQSTGICPQSGRQNTNAREELVQNTQKYNECAGACFCKKSKNGKPHQKEIVAQRSGLATTDAIQQKKDSGKEYEVTTLVAVTGSLLVLNKVQCRFSTGIWA